MVRIMTVGTGRAGTGCSPLSQAVKIFHIAVHGGGIQSITGHHSFVPVTPDTDLGGRPVFSVTDSVLEGSHVMVSMAGGAVGYVMVPMFDGIAMSTADKCDRLVGVTFLTGKGDLGAGNHRPRRGR